MAIKDAVKKVVKKATKKEAKVEMTRKEFMQKGFNKTEGYAK